MVIELIRYSILEMFGNKINTVLVVTPVRTYSKEWAPGANNRAIQIISLDFKMTSQYTQPHLTQYGVEGRDSFQRE